VKHATKTAPKTSVSILSDSRLFREAIGAWLKRQEEIHWVAVAGTMQQLLQRLGGRAADVLLVHAKPDGILGRHLAFDVRTLLPAARLIVLQSQRGAQDLDPWREAGAMDYLQHDSSPAQLMESIRDAAGGCPSSSVARHPRVVGSFRRALWISAHGDGCAAPLPGDECGMAAAWKLHAASLKARAERQRRVKSAHAKDSSQTAFRHFRGTARA
jgi:DNA-binding NarL/FixJ family response regulator